MQVWHTRCDVTPTASIRSLVERDVLSLLNFQWTREISKFPRGILEMFGKSRRRGVRGVAVLVVTRSQAMLARNGKHGTPPQTRVLCGCWRSWGRRRLATVDMRQGGWGRMAEDEFVGNRTGTAIRPQSLVDTRRRHALGADGWLGASLRSPQLVVGTRGGATGWGRMAAQVESSSQSISAIRPQPPRRSAQDGGRSPEQVELQLPRLDDGKFVRLTRKSRPSRTRKPGSFVRQFR